MQMSHVSGPTREGGCVVKVSTKLRPKSASFYEDRNHSLMANGMINNDLGDRDLEIQPG